MFIMIKTIVLTALGTVAVMVLGMVIAKEIVDYMQYQQVLRAVDALVAL